MEPFWSHVARVLDRLGYRASLRVVRENYLPGAFAESRSGGQIGWFTWCQDYPAPSNFIEPLLACSAFIPHDEFNLNLAEYCDPKINARIKRAQALQAADIGTAGKMWSEIDRDLVDQAPWVPLGAVLLASAKERQTSASLPASRTRLRCLG